MNKTDNTLKKFLQRNKYYLRLSNIEYEAKVPRSTISHTINSDNRPMPGAYEGMIIRILAELHLELSKMLVKESIALPSKLRKGLPK
jgi:hypothetical protein